jgi:putative restriction endonuclease
VHRGGAHRVDNGLLLRSDIHKLFDKGYVTVTPAGEFRVSKRLGEEWHNGRIYYDLDKRQLRRPIDDGFQPAKEFLEWHADTLFKG